MNGPAVQMLATGGRLIVRSLPLDATTLRRGHGPGSLGWKVPGWARATGPLVGAAVMAGAAWGFASLGEGLVGLAALSGVAAAAMLIAAWSRGAFQGTMEVRAGPFGVELRQGGRVRRVARSEVQAVQRFGQEHWEFSQHGGWRVRYALGLRLGGHTLVVGHCRDASTLEHAARELAAALRAPLDPPAPKGP